MPVKTDTNMVYLVPRNVCIPRADGAIDADILNVVDYKLELGRTRNKYDVPYGNCPGGRLKVTLDVRNIQDCKAFYENLKSKTSLTYSLMFKKPTESDRKNKDLRGIIFDGYIVGLEENYSIERVITQQGNVDFSVPYNNLTVATLLNNAIGYIEVDSEHIYLTVEFLVSYSAFINGESSNNYQFSN